MSQDCGKFPGVWLQAYVLAQATMLCPARGQHWVKRTKPCISLPLPKPRPSSQAPPQGCPHTTSLGHLYSPPPLTSRRSLLCSHEMELGSRATPQAPTHSTLDPQLHTLTSPSISAQMNPPSPSSPHPSCQGILADLMHRQKESLKVRFHSSPAPVAGTAPQYP